MKKLKFEKIKSDNFYEYHLSSNYLKWLEKTVFTNKGDFYSNKLEEYYFDVLQKFGYFYATHEENIFIFINKTLKLCFEVNKMKFCFQSFALVLIQTGFPFRDLFMKVLFGN